MNLSKTDIANCKNEELKQVLNRFYEYKNYCDLLPGNNDTLLKTEQIIGAMPVQLKEWLSLFDGGLLFTTSMFSSREIEYGKFNALITFEEANSIDYKNSNGIHDSLVCFAATNYGNYFCYVPEENSECVYEWDPEEDALTLKWNTFAEWLNEQIDFAVTLIEEKLLDPFGN